MRHANLQRSSLRFDKLRATKFDATLLGSGKRSARAFRDRSSFVFGNGGSEEALAKALAILVSYIGRMPEIWRKSKIVITANGEMTIRCRQEDGRMGIQRYRVRQGVSEIWEDE
ncbi:hypothetical protein RFN29_14075 [Mesorhizobium sp. VK22B]|uniref:Uncharacterized protein n=1 Tax=Mesorhizobium captivum TaxID=3072319 RepID=A0ABU4Z0D7_9HYPH|nr:hypothetical protein [Mesorhizobium sp. VK22B]MDX8492702.1 hypothetical protein [Mesorhizobium sp. VK22B]